MNYITRNVLEQVLARVGAVAEARGDFYLIGETSLVWEDHRSWTDEIEVCMILDQGAEDVLQGLKGVSEDLGVTVVNEFPGDVVPLPDDWRERCRSIVAGAALRLSHFDPYSVSLRFLARGDDEDYGLVLGYLEHGWVSLEEMDDVVTALLPHFSFETIAQDPAEFRRKYKGLQQMAKARGG